MECDCDETIEDLAAEIVDAFWEMTLLAVTYPKRVTEPEIDSKGISRIHDEVRGAKARLVGPIAKALAITVPPELYAELDDETIQ